MTDKPIGPLRQRMIEDSGGASFCGEGPRRTASNASRASRLSSAARPMQAAPRTFVCFNGKHDEDPCEPGGHQPQRSSRCGSFSK